MRSAAEDSATRTRVLLVLLAASAFTALAPSLMSSSPSVGVAALAAVALAAATLVGLGVLGVALALRPAVGRQRIGDEEPPTLSGRVTDPAHHPLCPRAPGQN